MTDACAAAVVLHALLLKLSFSLTLPRGIAFNAVFGTTVAYYFSCRYVF